MIRQMLTLLALSLAAGAACAGEFCDEYGLITSPLGNGCRIDLEPPPTAAAAGQVGALGSPPPIAVRAYTDPLQDFSVCARWPADTAHRELNIVEFAFAPADGTNTSQVLALGVAQDAGRSYLVVDWVGDVASGWTQGGTGLLPPAPVALLPITDCDYGPFSKFTVSLSPDHRQVVLSRDNVMVYRSPKRANALRSTQLRVARFGSKNGDLGRVSTLWLGVNPES